MKLITYALLALVLVLAVGVALSGGPLETMLAAPLLMAPIMHTNRQTPGVAIGKRMRYSAQTANYTVTEAESGSIFTNRGATAEVVFTLPAIAEGLFFYFTAVAGQAIVVVTPTADTLIAFNDTAADQIAINTANEIIGMALFVHSDGTNWIANEMIHDAFTTAAAT